MSEIPGQGRHSLPDFQPPICANNGRKLSRSLVLRLALDAVLTGSGRLSTLRSVGTRIRAWLSGASLSHRASTAEGWLSRCPLLRKPPTPPSTNDDPAGLAT